MVFVWVLSYGFAYTVSRQIEAALHLQAGLTALVMALYDAVLLVWLIRTGRGRRIGLRLPDISGTAMYLAMLPLLILPACNLLYRRAQPVSWDVLSLLLCAAVAEELLFRGWLLFKLSHRPRTAVCASGLLFALLHAANLTSAGNPEAVLFQMLCALAFGIACGAVTLRCGSVVPAIGAHVLVNLTGAYASQPVSVFCACAGAYALFGIWLCNAGIEKN